MYGYSRTAVDPLSMALKKYHERGGSANAAAQGFVGIYSPEDRKQRIMRFLEKRKRRMWTKKVKYDVRKVSLRSIVPCIFANLSHSRCFADFNIFLIIFMCPYFFRTSPTAVCA